MTTIALSTGSLYSYGLARVFELAAEAGFDAIEIMVDDRWDNPPAGLSPAAEPGVWPAGRGDHNPFLPHIPGWPSDPLGRLRLSASWPARWARPLS